LDEQLRLQQRLLWLLWLPLWQLLFQTGLFLFLKQTKKQRKKCLKKRGTDYGKTRVNSSGLNTFDSRPDTVHNHRPNIDQRRQRVV
jgi:hypothetical protein